MKRRIRKFKLIKLYDINAIIIQLTVITINLTQIILFLDKNLYKTMYLYLMLHFNDSKAVGTKEGKKQFFFILI